MQWIFNLAIAHCIVVGALTTTCHKSMSRVTTGVYTVKRANNEHIHVFFLSFLWPVRQVLGILLVSVACFIQCSSPIIYRGFGSPMDNLNQQGPVTEELYRYSSLLFDFDLILQSRCKTVSKKSFKLKDEYVYR